MSEWFGVELSHSGALKALRRADWALNPTFQAIRKGVKASNRVHVDETGWYVQGESYWAWVAATSNLTLYRIAHSRGHEVAEELIGADYKGCLHTDFLNTYRALKCRKSKCMAHLLVHMKKLLKLRDGEPARSARRSYLADIKAIVQDAILLWKQREACEPEVYERHRNRVNERLDQALRHKPQDPDNRRLRKRLLKHRPEIFLFLEDKDAEPTNNLAERELRPLVVNRKLSAGSRTEKGADRTAKFFSVYATLKRQGVKVVDAILDALLGRRTILLNSS